jgi:hypothetical protein
MNTTNKCVHCSHAILPTAKFCPECGSKQPDIDKENPTSKVIGDKNVVSTGGGDIFSGTKVTGTQIVYYPKDDTKSVICCSICGKNDVFLNSISCPVCTKMVCSEHFNKESKRCANCTIIAENQYQRQFEVFFEKNRIDASERAYLNELSVSLFLNSNIIDQLEQKVKDNKAKKYVNSGFTDYLKIELTKSLNYLYEKDDLLLANNALSELHAKHHDIKEFSYWHYFLEAIVNPAEYLRSFNSRTFDSIWQHYWSFLAHINNSNESLAYAAIEETKAKFDNEISNFDHLYATFYILMYIKYKEEGISYYNKAKDLLIGLNPNRDILESILPNTVLKILNFEEFNYTSCIYDFSLPDENESIVLLKYLFRLSDIRPLEDGYKYSGKFKNGNLYGKGVLYYPVDDPNGRLKYDGFFLDGKRSGKGVLSWKNSDRYEGDWVDDQRQGIGIYYYSDGHRCDGTWVADKINGWAISYYPNNNLEYEGNWENSKMNGNGIYYFKDGSKFEGNFRDGQIDDSE